MKYQKPWLQAIRDRDEALKNPPPPPKPIDPKDLTPKRMKDSFHKLVLPLSTDEWLLDTYVNYAGQLRIGSLFQDLDALAGVISYKVGFPP